MYYPLNNFLLTSQLIYSKYNYCIILIKKFTGIHAKKHATIVRVTDTSSDLQKSKQFLPFLQRAGRLDGVVEFVSSGSRFRVYIPGETVLITLLLSGISCPRASRIDTGSGGEPFGDEALTYVKDLIMQKEVQIEIDGMDKGGNFIGFLFIDGMYFNLTSII